MGGAVARYTRNDRLWWLFGVGFDDSDFGTTWIPYVGASLILNQRCSVSALLPWPQIIYAPSQEWFVSLGASYSGNSWALDSTTGAVGLVCEVERRRESWPITGLTTLIALHVEAHY